MRRRPSVAAGASATCSAAAPPTTRPRPPAHRPAAPSPEGICLRAATRPGWSAVVAACCFRMTDRRHGSLAPCSCCRSSCSARTTLRIARHISCSVSRFASPWHARASVLAGVKRLLRHCLEFRVIVCNRDQTLRYGYTSANLVLAGLTLRFMCTVCACMDRIDESRSLPVRSGDTSVSPQCVGAACHLEPSGMRC